MHVQVRFSKTISIKVTLTKRIIFWILEYWVKFSNNNLSDCSSSQHCSRGSSSVFNRFLQKTRGTNMQNIVRLQPYDSGFYTCMYTDEEEPAQGKICTWQRPLRNRDVLQWCKTCIHTITCVFAGRRWLSSTRSRCRQRCSSGRLKPSELRSRRRSSTSVHSLTDLFS